MEIMAGVCLLIESIWDIKTRKIPLWISLGFGCSSFFYSLCCQRSYSSFFFALLPGQAIGYGDGILLCALAMLYPLEELMELIVVAIFFAGIVGFILLIVFRKSGKFEIPFVPFLFLAWITK